MYLNKMDTVMASLDQRKGNMAPMEQAPLDTLVQVALANAFQWSEPPTLGAGAVQLGKTKLYLPSVSPLVSQFLS